MNVGGVWEIHDVHIETLHLWSENVAFNFQLEAYFSSDCATSSIKHTVLSCMNICTGCINNELHRSDTQPHKKF